MDHMMPEMDGVEATRRIRALEGKRFKTMPIIALTANAVSGARDNFLAAGMNDFISKPIDAGVLNRKLIRWLPKTKVSIPRGAGKASHPASFSAEKTALNRAAGIRNTGSEELYRQLLANFRNDHRTDPERIGAALAEGNLSLAYRLAHTLKSTAALLGAEGVRRTAAALEKFLAEENAAAAAEHREELDRQFTGLLRELDLFLPERIPQGQKRQKTSRAQILDMAERLTPLLASGDTRSLEMLKEMGNVFSGLDEKGDLLVKQIGNFEFENALVTLEDIKGQAEP
jgi:CheY-like chemotaxis protein